MPVELKRRVFSVEEYEQMIEARILTQKDKVELIQGEIVEMAPIETRHSASVNRLNAFFHRVLAQQVIVSIQSPAHLGESPEPEPDVLLLRPRVDFYAKARPQPEDVLLLVEVADSSLTMDREVKGPLYSRQGVVEYWIVNLLDEVLEVYREPSPDGYLSQQTLERTDRIDLVSFPDVQVAVIDLLG